MNSFNDYPLTVTDSLRGLYDRIILYLPNLIVALLVLIVGWIIGSVLGNLVKRLLVLIKVDVAANQLGLERLSAKTGRNLSIAGLGQWVVKWFFFLASLIAAADILGLTEVTQFLYQQVVPYAGHVVVAMVILLLGILAANFFAGIVSAAVKASGMVSSAALGSLTRWAIIIFTVLAVLSQLQLASDFLGWLFEGIVAMLALAGGLAFGLGGKEHAKKILDEVEVGLRSRH